MTASRAWGLDILVPPRLREPTNPEFSRARVLSGFTLTGGMLGLVTAAHRLSDPMLESLPRAGLWGGLVCIALSGALLRGCGLVEASASVLFLGAAVFLPLDALGWGGVGGASLAAAVALPLLASFMIEGQRVVGITVAISVALVYVWLNQPEGPVVTPAQSPMGQAVNIFVSLALLWAVTVLAVLSQNERRRMLHQLAEREARYAAAIAADHAGVFEWRPGVGVVGRSSRLVEMLGTGPPFRDLVPASGRGVDDELAQLREGQRSAIEAARTRVDGATEWYRFDLLGVDTPEGTAVVGVVRNITEARHVAQLKDEFLAVVSHELRSPLTSIYGAIALLRSAAFEPGADPARSMQDELLSIAHTNSQRLLGLVDELLDVQRLEAGGLRFLPEAIPVQPTVEGVVQAFSTFASTHRCRIVVDGDPVDADLFLDRRRFEQVLGNFLANACKWTAPETAVRVSLRQEEERVRITVTDAGPGIPDSFRAHVFERFTQASAGANRQRGGTGLGLFIARRFTENMGGSIGFSSEEGEGAAFWVEFPTRSVAAPG